MENRDIPLFPLGFALLLSLGGCVTEPVKETVEDPRLDQVVSKLEQSLANQASVNAQLQAQQRQLLQQEKNLVALSDNLEKVQPAPQAPECPEVAACPQIPETFSKMIVGSRENVWFPDLGLALTAKIDTGAATASIDAQDIQQFERDGKPWVRFKILNPDSDTPKMLERRLVRSVGIYQAGATEVKRRPVVKLSIVIGDVEQTAEFGLSSRTHTTYQVILGRSILKDVMVVDVSETNVAPFAVPEKPAAASGNAQ